MVKTGGETKLHGARYQILGSVSSLEKLSLGESRLASALPPSDFSRSLKSALETSHNAYLKVRVLSPVLHKLFSDVASHYVQDGCQRIRDVQRGMCGALHPLSPSTSSRYRQKQKLTTLRQVHKLCQDAAPRILQDFQPQLMIAIGGGGYVPARILRSFLKTPGSPNIPMQGIGLSLYEQLPPTHNSASETPGEVEEAGTKVTRTQWLDFTSLGEIENLVGKRILIVDEVDDTRTTLEYAVKELEKDVDAASKKLGFKGEKTVFSIFVLHVSLTPHLSWWG